jgi:hypothetical protein
MNNLATGELYSSPNGDRWHLCRDAPGDVFVLRQPNIPWRANLPHRAFRFPFAWSGPEQQALLQMIESLVPSDIP